MAVGNEKGSYVAACVEVAVDPSGALKVVRVVEAFECGAIINPDGLRNQVVGAIIQGLGGALFEAVRFRIAAITNPHLASYRVPRFRDVPALETILLDRKDIAPAGAGEIASHAEIIRVARRVDAGYVWIVTVSSQKDLSLCDLPCSFNQNPRL